MYKRQAGQSGLHIFYTGEGYLPDLAVFLQIVDEIVVNQFGQWFVDGVQKHGYRKAIVVQLSLIHIYGPL